MRPSRTENNPTMLYFTLFTIILCSCFVVLHQLMISSVPSVCEGPECVNLMQRAESESTEGRSLRSVPALPPVSSPQSKRKRLIFAATTGHSGTVWLSQLLSCTMKHIKSEHEAQPSLVYFDRVLQKGLAATYNSRWDHKIPAFQRSLEGMRPGNVYADIDHMFVKSWGDVVMDYLREEADAGRPIDIDVIILRRSVAHTVRSLVTQRIPWDLEVPPENNVGGVYTLYNDEFVKLKPIGKLGSEDAIDMATGYVIDIELQTLAFMEKYPEARYIEVRAEEIFTANGARALLQQLGLSPLDRSCLNRLLAGGLQNSHVASSTARPVEDLAKVKRKVKQFIERHKAAGRDIPLLPHLQELAPCPDDAGSMCPVNQTRPLEPAEAELSSTSG